MKDQWAGTNVSEYEEMFQEGYGLQYPDGHVIRVHRHILEDELGVTEGKILDYGCGSGAHLRYFVEQGFVPYGCDTSETAIDACKKTIPDYADNFVVTDPVPNLAETYGDVTFDVIMSNQVLYFIDDEGISNLVAQFSDLLRPRGIFFATMVATTSHLNDHVVATDGEMSKVDVHRGDRLNTEWWVNFKTKEEVMELFAPFEKLHLGYYGHTIREGEGPTDHHIYVGLKPSS